MICFLNKVLATHGLRLREALVNENI